jgi:hypothetical protein
MSLGNLSAVPSKYSGKARFAGLTGLLRKTHQETIMRCVKCGWIVPGEGCPCRYSKPRPGNFPLPKGTRVVFRYGRGASMPLWATGEVVGQQGRLYQVGTKGGAYWCEGDDLLPEAPEREQALKEGTRVWALWLDGRWFPGIIDDCEGPVRRVLWDDGDCMWVDAYQAVIMAGAAVQPAEGALVFAKHWQGNIQPARVEQQDGMRYRVVFRDGEEAWFPADDLTTVPPNPFDT